MDVKAKREYMMRYQNAQNRIIGLTHEIEKWQGIAEKVNSAINNSGISACDNSSKVERGAINVADIITSIQIEINSAKDVREEVLAAIHTKCGKIRYRELLEMRFVNDMSEREIEKINKKDVKSISKAITAAIKSMDI